MNEEQGLFPMVAEADNHDVVGTTRKGQNKHRLL